MSEEKREHEAGVEALREATERHLRAWRRHSADLVRVHLRAAHGDHLPTTWDREDYVRRHERAHLRDQHLDPESESLSDHPWSLDDLEAHLRDYEPAPDAIEVERLTAHLHHQHGISSAELVDAGRDPVAAHRTVHGVDENEEGRSGEPAGRERAGRVSRRLDYEEEALNGVRRSWLANEGECQALALADAQVYATLHLARQVAALLEGEDRP